MPLIASASFAYAAGDFAALTLSPRLAALLLALVLGAGIVVLLRSHSVNHRATGTCLLLAAGGVLAGTSARSAAVRCGALLARAPHLRASLQGDAYPGAVVRASVRHDGCQANATLLVRTGTGRAGEDATIVGDASAGDRGLFVRDAHLSDAATGAALVRVRARAGRRIDRLFGGDAPLVRALVIADMAAIPAEQRDRFARAGLVHMLSVSGLHVAIVALAFQLLAAALRAPPVPAGLCTILLLGAYVIGIGAPPPAVRAAIMLSLVLASRLLQRPTSRWAVVSVGSVVPLIDPLVVVDLGWQLSVAGTIALVAGGALARRALPGGWRGMRRNLATAAVVSVVATLATAPLVAWTFGRLAVLGPLTNLLADPVMAVLQPVLFLALCLPFAGAERLLADAAHVLIAVFDGIAARAAAVPFAAPSVMPSTVAAIASGVAAVALVVACLSRHPARAMVAGLAAVAVMVAEPLLQRDGEWTELHMLDVGQGDALALRTRAGRWVLVDAGRSWAGGDAGKGTVVPYVAHRGGSVALFAMSHPHADHVGGASSLLDALHPGAFLDPGYPGASPPYLAALDAARRDRIPWRRVHPGDSVVVDEAVVTVLAPDSAWVSRLDDANLASAVLSIRVGATRLLLTGDAERAEEDWLLAHDAGALASDVLKVAHHGSATSSTPAFVDAVRPRVALVSVGAHNSYGHPSADVMRALQAAGAQVLRTDQLGTIVVRTDGRRLEVEAHGLRWTVPPRPR